MQLELDKWQKEILETEGNVLLCTGRQVGKTTIFARKAVEFMVKHKSSRIIVVSLTEDQAQLMIAMALNYIDQNYKPYRRKAKKPTKSQLWLNNKSTIIARPVGNTGDAVRGFTGDVLIVDEASRMPEPMWAASKPTLATTGGQIWMCSTPHGRQGYFYECYLNKHGRFKVFHVNTPQVYAERKWANEQMRREALEFIEQERKDMSGLEFGQEYMGQFLEDLQQLFPDKLIQERMVRKRPESVQRGRDYAIGVDIARMGEDETTFEIGYRKGDKVVQVENLISSKTLLTETADRILSMDRIYDFKRIYVDDEGIGIGVFDILISNDRTKRKVEGLKNSKKVIDYKNDRKRRMLKVDLYMNLLKMMERGDIDLLDDDSIFQSLKSVQYEYTTDKKGQPFLHIFGNYTHIAEGLIRLAWFGKSKNLSIWIDCIQI